MKDLVRVVVGAIITWISHMLWPVRTLAAAIVRWAVASYGTHLVLNSVGY